MMTSLDLVNWLQERTELSILSQSVLTALAPQLQEQVIPPEQAIVLEDMPIRGLYILAQGCAESNKPPQNLSLSQTVGLLPGTVIGLQELLLNQTARETVLTFTECKLWFISAQAFRTFVAQYPEISQAFSQYLAQEVQELSSQLSYEQERQTLLRPYIVSKVKRGIVGKSRYALRLRQQVKQAADDRQAVLIFGEPGLEKDNIASLIHFSSPSRRETIIKVDCSTLQVSGVELFGRSGGKPGLITMVGQGTLILNNIQELPSELIGPLVNLLRTGSYQPVGGDTPIILSNQARIIMVSEKSFNQINPLVGHLIKAPPLRVRKADLADYSEYFLRLICRAKGIPKSDLTPEALRRLQAYDFPNNLRELESLLERAIIQLGTSNEITEEIIWPSQSKKKQFRLNLLNAYPRLRHFLRSKWWPERINYGFILTAFALVVAILFLGPQNRAENFALNLFWAWWWPLILLGFPFLGRIWCSICPFMIYGEVTQKLSLWLFPRELKRWPRQSAEKWGGWFLFGLFTLILLWEELWNLENTAYLSACLLLLITAGAMIFSAIFERRFWCRYLCPIGGMNGLFAKVSMTELRAQQGTCSAECTTYQCYKGGPQKGEGQQTDGCPLYSHPAQLQDNRDCVLCMTCLKACPHRSVEFNLRPPGIELWTTHVPRSYEVALLFLLLGAVFLHHLLEWQGDLTSFGKHFVFSVLALGFPVVIPVLAYGITRLLAKLRSGFKLRSFTELAYGYLPLVLAGNLAHYLYLGLNEGGRILPVGFATFGFSGEGLPILVAHPAVISFLQGSTLIVGVILSVVLLQKIARQPWWLLLPQHLSTIILGLALWVIIISH